MARRSVASAVGERLPGRGEAADRAPIADAIVVAAGTSSRMGAVDKLAVEIGGRPLLAWSVSAIAAAPEVRRIVVVAAPARVAELSRASWLPDKVADVVGGGGRRQESVHAGFEVIRAGQGGDPVVLVHDGARPALSPELVSAVVRAAAEHGAAIPVLPVAETLKRIDGDVVNETVDRSGLATAQTPQGARRSLLAEAFERFPASGTETWTDEAALLEACNIRVHAIPGEPDNLKVTVPDDLRRVTAILAPARTGRAGLGHDSHPFGPGEPLHLGGVAIPGAPRLAGHSDGDVVLHAVADALLGAAGLGDLGRLFPADERTPRGIASAELLSDVRRRVAAAGLEAGSVDVTIVGARPRLAGHLDEMRARIAELVGLDTGAVNVKASTGNLDGNAGAGRGIEAHAIALVRAARRPA
jgi:2-C-methyl-D-erythritol 4-phosphate cytidylyltransferase/2-C-methyl-D-erythritol 2,4-cyclodiphosphate synthase